MACEEISKQLGHRQGHRAQCAGGQKECAGGVSLIVQQSPTSGMLFRSENLYNPNMEHFLHYFGKLIDHKGNTSLLLFVNSIKKYLLTKTCKEISAAPIFHPLSETE